MEAQLNQAYELIKDGRTDEALPLLENIIRENRDNDDAWWLYANGVTDPDAKRNALNNILRIGTNEARLEKVHFMLAQLDDPFALPDTPTSQATSQKKSSAFSLKMVLTGIAVCLGLCACVSIFSLFSYSAKLVYVPENYDNRGEIIAGEAATGMVDTEGDLDGYYFDGKAGDEIVISVRPVDESIAPFILLYDSDNTLVAYFNESDAPVIRLRQTLPEDGQYIVIVRTFMGMGEGEYTINMTSNG